MTVNRSAPEECSRDWHAVLPDLWGSTSVFQCPFSHGWEMRDKRLAALAAGGEAVHAALLLRGWTDDVVVLTDGRPDMSPAEVNALRSGNVTIDDRRIAALIGHDGELTEIAFADGTRMQRDGLLVEAPLRQRTPLAKQLGTACTPSPLAADTIGIDDIHRTNTGGVFAAGDTCTQHPHVADAVAAVSQAAMMIVQSLLADEFGLPYPPM
jgi:thioredoxin reductase